MLETCEGIAGRIAALASSVLAALTPAETRSVLSAIRAYRGTSPQMVGFGTLILQSLPED